MTKPVREPKVLWDPRKARANLQKHKVSFEEAETVLKGGLSVTKPDPDHSFSERRSLTLELSCNRRLILVAHTENPDKIRIISARRPTRRERDAYENH